MPVPQPILDAAELVQQDADALIAANLAKADTAAGLALAQSADDTAAAAVASKTQALHTDKVALVALIEATYP